MHRGVSRRAVCVERAGRGLSPCLGNPQSPPAHGSVLCTYYPASAHGGALHSPAHCPLRCSAQTHWPCPLQWTTTLPAENQCNATLPIDTHYLAWIQLLYYNTMCTIINNVCAILCPLFTVVRSTVTVTPLQYLKLDFTVRGWGRVETRCYGDIVVFTILWQMKREEGGFPYKADV